MKKSIRKKRKLSDGFEHGLEATEAIDLNKVKNFDELARAMAKTAFGGRQLGEAVAVLEIMVKDKDCFVVGTFSGAMTPAKQGLLICEMIDRGMLNAVVATGALMAHGFVEATGLKHFKYQKNPHLTMTDPELFLAGYNRIYDTLEPEKNLDHIEEIIDKVLSRWSPKQTLSSHSFHRQLGKYLAEHSPHRGILKSAYLKGVPVYVPAFTDSEIGLDFAIHNKRRAKQGRKQLRFDPFLDLEHYTGLIQKQKKLGIFTIGGGVPRNWAQQVGPYLDILERRLGGVRPIKFQYGVRVCPEPVQWGGLSGSTYSEGVSWGKFVPAKEGGRFAEVWTDATIAWPIILKAVLERVG